MIIRKTLIISLCVLMSLFTSQWVYAQNASSGDSKWEFQVIPYFWLATEM